eukprot:125579_1
MSEEWSCGRCTGMNDFVRTRCEFCHADRPNNANSSSDAGSAGKQPMRWDCPKCTFGNSSDKQRCGMCGTDKPIAISDDERASPPSSRTPPRVFVSNGSRLSAAAKPAEKPPAGSRGSEAQGDGGSRKPSSSSIQSVIAMCQCSEEHAVKALQKKNCDVEGAIVWVLSNPELLSPNALRKREEKEALEQIRQAEDAEERELRERKESARARRATIEQQAAARKKEILREEQERIILMEKEEKEQPPVPVKRRVQISDKPKKPAASRLAERSVQLAAARESEARTRTSSLLAWHARQEAHEAEERRLIAETKMAREYAEAQMHSIPDAMEYLTKRLGDTRRNRTLRILDRLASNVLAHPAEPRYTTLKASDPQFRAKVADPIGGLVILRLMGFEQSEDGTQWRIPRPSADILEKARAHFKSCLVRDDVSFIPEFVKSFYKEKGVEVAYYACLKLLDLVDNLVTLHDTTMVRRIDIHDSVFRCAVGRHLAAVGMLKKIGFHLQRSKGCLVYQEPADKKTPSANLRLVRDDLKDAVKRLSTRTPIYKALVTLKSSNSPKNVDLFVYKFLRCLDKIIAEPLALQFQKIRLDLFSKKIGNIKNGKQMFKIFSFVISHEKDICVATYRPKFPDSVIMLEWTKSQRQNLEYSWSRVKKLAVDSS